MRVQHQADPSVRNKKSETALDLACQYGRLDTVELLLAGSRLVRAGSVWSDSVVLAGTKSPLHLAARSGHRHVIQALLDAGFNINHKVLYMHSVLCIFSN